MINIQVFVFKDARSGTKVHLVMTFALMAVAEIEVVINIRVLVFTDANIDTLDPIVQL